MQWTLNSQPIPSDVNTSEMDMGVYTLTVPSLKAEHYGNYRCWGKPFDNDRYISFYSIATIENQVSLNDQFVTI